MQIPVAKVLQGGRTKSHQRTGFGGRVRSPAIDGRGGRDLADDGCKIDRGFDKCCELLDRNLRFRAEIFETKQVVGTSKDRCTIIGCCRVDRASVRDSTKWKRKFQLFCGQYDVLKHLQLVFVSE